MAGERILVVEDETITALDIQQSLRGKGFVVPGMACTGPEAVNLARETRPDLVLMDIRLKGEMDGIEAARQIHAELNVPIVFLTAYADCATLQRAKAAQPFAYLLKPFDDAVLSTTIEIALNKHRAHEMLVQQGADALHLSQTRFQHLTENVPEYAILMLDPAGQILSWSTGAEKIHGWPAGEVLGRHFSLLYPAVEVERGKPQQDLAAAVHTGRLLEYCPQLRKNDSLFSAQTSLVALRNSQGATAGFLKVTREVTPGGNHN